MAISFISVRTAARRDHSRYSSKSADADYAPGWTANRRKKSAGGDYWLDANESRHSTKIGPQYALYGCDGSHGTCLRQLDDWRGADESEVAGKRVANPGGSFGSDRG